MKSSNLFRLATRWLFNQRKQNNKNKLVKTNKKYLPISKKGRSSRNLSRSKSTSQEVVLWIRSQLVTLILLSFAVRTFQFFKSLKVFTCLTWMPKFVRTNWNKSFGKFYLNLQLQKSGKNFWKLVDLHFILQILEHYPPPLATKYVHFKH